MTQQNKSKGIQIQTKLSFHDLIKDCKIIGKINGINYFADAAPEKKEISKVKKPLNLCEKKWQP